MFTHTPEDVLKVATLLNEGDVVALPTETVYGLAADAMNENAVRRIFTIKGRPLIDPLIVHIYEFAQLSYLVRQLPEVVEVLAEAFWPGPLTLVLPKADCVPDIVTAGKPSVAIRMPAHPAMRDVLRACARPLAAPSANPFGYVSPTTAQHVVDSLGDRVPFVLDDGPCSSGLESTILSLLPPEPVILRPGPLSADAISKAFRRPIPIANSKPANTKPAESESQLAPGMLGKHYSPHTSVHLFSADAPPNADADAVILWQQTPEPEILDTPGQHYWLSDDGDPNEVARQLFAILRKLDQLEPRMIYVEMAPESELSSAINDRLRRAANK